LPKIFTKEKLKFASASLEKFSINVIQSIFMSLKQKLFSCNLFDLTYNKESNKIDYDKIMNDYLKIYRDDWEGKLKRTFYKNNIKIIL
jgi:hypothetical protein